MTSEMVVPKKIVTEYNQFKTVFLKMFKTYSLVNKIICVNQMAEKYFWKNRSSNYPTEMEQWKLER